MSDRTGRRCVFCDAAGKMDKEHILPDWLTAELPDLGQGWHERIGAFGADKGTWHDAPFTVTVGTVCPACNQGWMSDIENQVKPWLSPMLHGRGRTYHAGGLTILATWAAKTALVIASRSASMPRTPYEHLYRERRPSQSTAIWLGAFHTGPHRLYRTFVPIHRSGAGAAPGETNAYCVTFTVGHALFHVFGNESGRPSRHGFTGALVQSLRQIWPPPSEPAKWPPGPALTEPDLDAISNAYGEVF